MKGCYVLLMNLDSKMTIQFGKNHSDEFQAGWYAYVGSAMNGLLPRVERHLRKSKNIYWHIDYFLNYAIISKVYFLESTRPMECSIATQFASLCSRIPYFGSSDCHCKSHLFYGSKSELEYILNSLEMKEFQKQTLKKSSVL